MTVTRKEFDRVILEREGRVARIILNNPAHMNALDLPMYQAIGKAIDDLDDEDETRVAILKGAGKCFGAGGDLSVDTYKREKSAESNIYVAWQRRRKRFLDVVYNKIRAFRKPTIAQVHGYVIGSHLSPAFACDLVIASEDCLIGQPETRSIGGHASGMMTLFTVGPMKTKELLFTGDSITGKTAAEWGIINKAVPADQLEEHVEWLADRIAKQALDQLSFLKASVNNAMDIMGYKSMVDSDICFLSLYRVTPANEEFRQSALKHGLREAIELRDAPYGGPQRHGTPLKIGNDFVGRREKE
ncbi:MAG: enoyl-CoA hydratase/isomerase family protein [Chloroflexi bacterium]|nr:enoyl-CoA hydratase/isomerase family protein [Chloroflexota bacterium]